MHAETTQRALCPRCGRPQRSCICRWITAVANLGEVLILQHPLEVTHAKGSARLLQLCLRQSQWLVGEAFDAATLAAALTAPQRDGQPMQAVLLYPDTSRNGAAALAQAVPVAVPEQLFPTQIRLVLLDATWRKSRKMLYQNPLLQTLPRLSLQSMPPSHYRIRKAHAPDQLSSLEACAYALMQLERDPDKYQPLLAAFDGFVEQQMGWRLGG